jgi:predicted nucleotidyltransferase
MEKHPILKRRESERERLLDRARNYVACLPPSIRAAVVFGSVARGDFNLWSDVDLLLVADAWPDRWQDRMDLLPARPAAVQPIAWTVVEWQHQLVRRNPIASEVLERGVWLRGSPEQLGAV